MTKRTRLGLPVVVQGAEHLVIGFLMRRNILAYKAPTNHEGYDIICIHPDPRRSSRPVRVQVKTRYATDSNRGLPVKQKSLDAFDYLVIVFQNIGYYNRKSKLGVRAELQSPEFYTLPADFVRQHHSSLGTGWEVFRTRKLDLSPYLNELGFEQIVRDLRIPYPDREAA